MSIQLKLSVDQVSAAILLLNHEEKTELQLRLPTLLELEADKLEDMAWLRLAESAFSFWEDPEEDIYNDLIPTNHSGT